MKNYNEVLIGLFTVENGYLKVLLLKKKSEPYKGYWILPNEFLSKDTLEDTAHKIIKDEFGLKDVDIYQSHTFSETNRYENKRVVGTSFIALVDSQTINLKMKEVKNENAWFKIKEIPKMGFDHNKVITKLTADLKKMLLDDKLIKTFFPSDFTLSELQKLYEQLLNKKLDRRNFRKRIFKLDILEETGVLSDGKLGRPAMLYRFKDK